MSAVFDRKGRLFHKKGHELGRDSDLDCTLFHRLQVWILVGIPLYLVGSGGEVGLPRLFAVKATEASVFQQVIKSVACHFNFQDDSLVFILLTPSAAIHHPQELRLDPRHPCFGKRRYVVRSSAAQRAAQWCRFTPDIR